MNGPAELNQPHVPLANIRVLYIGRGAPKASTDSIEAIQKPLCELYTKDERRSLDTDVDAVLTVLTSGLLLEPVNPLDKDLWLPIQNLHSCAAVKAVVAPVDCSAARLSFVPVDSPSAAGSQYPAVFSCVMGRSNGLPLVDCYAFVCQSNDAAVSAVQAAMYAFGNRSGWATDRPTKAALAVIPQCPRDKIVVDGGDADDTPSEFYEKPPLSGFFYTPSPGLIQKYRIRGGGSCSTEARPYGDLRTPYIPELPPNPPVNPMIFFDTEQDTVFVDQTTGLQYPALPGLPAGPPEGSFRIRDASPPQSIAFNPYLVPSLDPPVAIQPPVVLPPVVKASTAAIPNDPVSVPEETVFIPVVRERGTYAPNPVDDPVYQRRLPRFNIGVPQASNNQDRRQAGHGGITRGYQASDRPVVDARPQAPFVVAKQPVEDLYSHRLPPPGQEPLPSGARQFDSNFILQQSDTDKARIADIRNFEGYPTPRSINIAEFGY